MSATMPIRVRVHDAWEEVGLDLDAGTRLSDVKRRALAGARRVGDPDAYEIKFRGAPILDESTSLEGAGVVRNAELIVLPRRRQAVR
ncbi:MAG TPA: hypothetical protein VFI39_03380 [Gemmatimonadales bacterium]|nr:hypothetical protein [Gemmatimonadales bacterium]